jgi:copper chaperone CopZ
MIRTISVESTSCEHCERTVEEALEGVDGVTDATADREHRSATVEEAAEADSLADAVADAGYAASV